MQCVVKRVFLAPLEHIDVEYEQRNLFELSVGKLHQEQLRHGVEPRLLRFVLINNALRALQGHMMRVEEPPISFSDPDLKNENTGSFICNTFKDGGLSLSPQSPPTPIKVRKLGSLLSDQSPLVSSIPFLGVCDNSHLCEDGEQCATSEFGRLVETTGRVKDEGGGAGEGDGGGGDKETGDTLSHSASKVCLGKHTNGVSEEEEILTVKKICSENLASTIEADKDMMKCVRPTALPVKDKLVLGSINGINGIHNGIDIEHISLPPHQSQQINPVSPTDPESDDESSTLSPIDFTKVDASLYDYDLSGQVPAANPMPLPHTTVAPLLSLVSTQPLTTMTTASITQAATTNSLSVSLSSEFVTCTPSVPIIALSKAAQTDSVLTRTTTNSSPHPHTKTQSIDLPNSDTFSGTSCSMEGIVSTQNGDHNDTNNNLTRNANSNKSCCSQEGVPEADFFEDLVSLLIT